MSGKRLVVSNPRQLINLKTQKLINSLPSSTRQLKKINPLHTRNPRLKNQKLEEVRRSYRPGGLEVKSQYLVINSELRNLKSNPLYPRNPRLESQKLKELEKLAFAERTRS